MSAWSPLRLPLFRALWLANVVSNIGSTMNDTTAVWTMVTLADSPLLVTAMQTMSSLPLFLLALPAGALADLVDRRKLIVAAQVGALLTAAGMAVLAHRGMMTPPLLLLATFQLGVASAFTMPAWQAMIPELVGKSQLSAALALGGVGFNVARSVGPIVGGVLVASLGPAPVFALNAVSFLAVIFVMARQRVESSPRSAEQEQMIGAMTAAIRYARHAAPMKSVLVRGAVHVFAAVAPVALLPVLVKARQGSASEFGALMGCYGAGAIFTALVVLPRLRERLSFDRVLAGASAMAAAAVGVLAVAPNRWVMGGALLVAGGAWLAAMNTLSVASQNAFPNWVRARSSAIYLVAVQGAFAAGAFAWGRLTSDFGAPVALGAASLWLLASGAMCRWHPISHLAQLDLTPSNHWRGHALAAEPAPEDGPVLITLEYRIDPARAAAFREAMRPLREVRLRDGAFRCSLFQDLEDPALFRETFLVGSWAEHLRQHQRATLDDQRIEAAVQAFHVGPEPVRIRHLLMVNLREAAGEG